MSHAYAKPSAEILDAHTRRDRRHLRNTSLAAAIGLYLWLLHQNTGRDVTQIGIGTAIYLLCVLPMISWIQNRTYKFPTMEAFLLSFLPTYAIPFLTAHKSLATYEAQTVIFAGVYTFLVMAAAALAYRATFGLPGRQGWWREEIITGNSLGILINVALGNVIYVVASTFFWQAPSGFDGPLRAVTSGMLIVCGFSLGRFWADGLLHKTQRTAIGLLLIVTFITQISSLFLVGAASLSMVCLLGYASAGKRMPWALILTIAVVLGVLHSSKAQMRAKYWDGLTGRQVSFANLPVFFTDWITMSLGGDSPEPGSKEEKATRGLLERGSLVHMLCLVVRETPDPRPHINGETYSGIPAQLVPRLIWPGKPTAHVSTSILGVYYGLQRSEDTLSTTISFGQVAEAYANFGAFGCILLGAFYGFITKKIMCLTMESPILSVPGVLLILYTTWLIDTGQTLAVWTGSLSQAFIAIGCLALALRKFVHG